MIPFKSALRAVPLLIALAAPGIASADDFTCSISTTNQGLRGVPHRYDVSYNGGVATLTYQGAANQTTPLSMSGNTARLAFPLGGNGHSNWSANPVNVSFEHDTGSGGLSVRFSWRNTGEVALAAGSCRAAGQGGRTRP